MRVLITGGRGQLGRALESALPGDDVTARGHSDLDITDRDSVQSAFQVVRPGVVIHTAAWTDTLGCERDPERALLVNGEGAGIVADECARVGASMVYISSNEVFDGAVLDPYTENAEARAINSYGRSKLEGERRVAGTLKRHCIVRTSWLYGPGRASFPEKVVEAARKQAGLRMVTDEIASPTYTVDLAEALARLIKAEGMGVYHLTNAEHCSRLEWAREVLDLCEMAEVEIEAVTQDEFNAPYRKPVFSALANTRAAELGIELRPWREALATHLSGVGALSNR